RPTTRLAQIGTVAEAEGVSGEVGSGREAPIPYERATPERGAGAPRAKRVGMRPRRRMRGGPQTFRNRSTVMSAARIAAARPTTRLAQIGTVAEAEGVSGEDGS